MYHIGHLYTNVFCSAHRSPKLQTMNLSQAEIGQAQSAFEVNSCQILAQGGKKEEKKTKLKAHTERHPRTKTVDTYALVCLCGADVG